jgi:hypothetical protein
MATVEMLGSVSVSDDKGTMDIGMYVHVIM